MTDEETPVVNAPVTFGTVTFEGQTKPLCLAILNGELVGAVGATRREAMENAFRLAFPELKSIKSQPAVDWSPHLADKAPRSRKRKVEN